MADNAVLRCGGTVALQARLRARTAVFRWRALVLRRCEARANAVAAARVHVLGFGDAAADSGVCGFGANVYGGSFESAMGRVGFPNTNPRHQDNSGGGARSSDVDEAEPAQVTSAMQRANDRVKQHVHAAATAAASAATAVGQVESSAAFVDGRDEGLAPSWPAGLHAGGFGCGAHW